MSSTHEYAERERAANGGTNKKIAMRLFTRARKIHRALDHISLTQPDLLPALHEAPGYATAQTLHTALEQFRDVQSRAAAPPQGDHESVSMELIRQSFPEGTNAMFLNKKLDAFEASYLKVVGHTVAQDARTGDKCK